MRVTEFNKKMTARSLNESVASQFGQKLKLESFTLEQLHDARNKLRTKLSQYRLGENYDTARNEQYQQTQMMLDVINLEIEERDSIAESFTDMELQVLKKVQEGLIDFTSLPEELQNKANTLREKGMASDVLESDEYYHDSRRTIAEGEEERAELIIAAKDMVDKITSWMEDTAQMQADAMLDIVDAIRDEHGIDMSHEFEAIVKPALASIYTALEAGREQLTNSVNLLTGQTGSEMNQSEEPMQPESPDLSGAGEEGQLVGSEAELPPADDEAAIGRPTRESIERGQRLGAMLSKKK